jgi:hypothetical protein
MATDKQDTDPGTNVAEYVAKKLPSPKGAAQYHAAENRRRATKDAGKASKKPAAASSKKTAELTTPRDGEPRTSSEGVAVLLGHINCLVCKDGPHRERKKKHSDCISEASPHRFQLVSGETLCAHFRPGSLYPGSVERKVLAAARPLFRAVGPPPVKVSVASRKRKR